MTMPDELEISGPSAMEIERAKQALEDLIWVMSTPQGRRWVYAQLEQCGVYRMSFAGEATHATAFNEGQRNVGLRILSAITQQVPKLYALMIDESQAAADAEAGKETDR